MTELIPAALLSDVRALIDAGHRQTAAAVNAGLVQVYWQVGRRIRDDVLDDERAEYGRRVIARLAERLVPDGSSFSQRNLHHMVRAADMFDAEQIVYAVRTQLTWTHLRELMSVQDPLKRRFYMEICRLERWSTRALKDKIGGLLYERTALAKQPEAVISDALDAVQDDGRSRSDLRE